MSSYAWHLTQVPVILGHLRDSMLPLQATNYGTTRVDGTREQPLPFRLEPMEDADQLWAELLDYGRRIARHIHPAPHALTGTAARQLRASTHWQHAAEAAYTVTAWLTFHEQRIADLNLDIDPEAIALFSTIGRALGKYRITPNRLRTTTTSCAVCGENAVRAEWAMNRNGDIAVTVQCTVCLQRYEPAQLPTRGEVLALWETPLDLEEVTGAAQLPASSETREALSSHHQAMA